MNKLNEIISRCKNSVRLDINDHRDVRADVNNYIDDDDVELIPALVLSMMISRDTIIRCQFYPFTSINSYDVYHYDLDKCLDEVIRILNEIKGV